MEVFTNKYLIEYKNLININKGLYLFHFGLFFLFSAPVIGLSFILISFFKKFNLKKNIFLTDPLNYYLLITSFLMCLSILIFPFLNNTFTELDYQIFTNPYLGILSWIPFFVFLYRVEGFLNTIVLRKYAAFFLTCSILPVILSGFSQEFLQIYGPIKLLNGLVIWYQRPNISGMTGLFNNQNYTACALSTCLPFAIAFLKTSDKKFIYLAIKFLTVLSIFCGVILTNSRNGWISLIIIFSLFTYKKWKNKFLFPIVFISLTIITTLNLIITNNKFIENFRFENLVNDPRVNIYLKSIAFIKERPILGWGGNSFSSIWNSNPNTENFFSHSHNIFLEFSIQYGLLAALLFSLFIFIIFYKSFKRIFILKEIKNSNNLIYEKAWFISSIVILFMNLLDIPYFDVRIGVLFWLLISGIKSISKGYRYN